MLGKSSIVLSVIISHTSIKNIVAFNRDPIAFLGGLKPDPISSFRMAHLRFHHVTGLDGVKQVLVYDQSKIVKTPKAQYFTALALGEGLVSTDGEAWTQKRKEANAVFRPQKIDFLLKAMVQEVQDAFTHGDYLGKQLPLNGVMMDMALRLICKLCFGFSDKAGTKEIGQVMDVMVVEAYRKIVSPLTLPLFIPSPANIRFNKSRKKYDHIIHRLTKKAFMEGEAEALVLAFLGEATGENHEGPNTYPIAMAMKTIIAAGHETTGTTLTWLLYEVSQNPEIEATMKDEISKTELNQSTSVQELLDNMPYTQWVISETLRMYPPIWLMGRMAKEAVDIGNVQFRKGDNFLISPFIIHRMEEYWDEPHTFRPERFRNSSKPFTQSAYFPFGLGPRQCIGSHLAIVEMLVILATLYQHCEVEIHCKEPMGYHPFITLRPSKNILLQLTPKNCS